MVPDLSSKVKESWIICSLLQKNMETFCMHIKLQLSIFSKGRGKGYASNVTTMPRKIGTTAKKSRKNSCDRS